MKKMFNNIRRIITWIPIIWKTRDWDYGYSIKVFKFQLERQAKFLESDRAITRSAKNDSSRIRTVIKLMDKVYNEDYALEYHDILEEKYGKDVLKPKFGETTKGHYYLSYEFESWDNAKEIQQLYDELFKKSAEKQERAHKLLWKLIEHNIRGWWD